MAAGPLQILNLHAQGGMAEVYRARAVDESGRTWTYAVKRMLPELLKDAEVRRMFVEEQRVASLLVHDNIVRVYDVARADTSDLFIVMEFMEGKDLAEMLEAASLLGKTLPVWFAIHVTREVLKALHYATTEARDKSGAPLNLIHRDISPHNVFITNDGQVKLTDFGVAKVETSEIRTRAGIIKGKFGYMSPEQLSAKELDPRSDLYAVGILLYEALTAEQLFPGATATESVAAMLKGVVPPFPKALQVPADLDALVRRALSKSRDDRPQTAAAFEAALAAISDRYRLGATRGHVAHELRALFPGVAPPPPPPRSATQPRMLTRLADASVAAAPDTAPNPPAGRTLDDDDIDAFEAVMTEPLLLAATPRGGTREDATARGRAKPPAPGASDDDDFDELAATLATAPQKPVDLNEADTAVNAPAPVRASHRVSTGSKRVIPIDDTGKKR